MADWLWGLLLKPLLGIAFLAALFGLSRILKIGLKAVFPEGRVKEYLFRGDVPGADIASHDASASHGGFDDPAITGRKAGENPPRLGRIGED
jgi:hypothetical protein